VVTARYTKLERSFQDLEPFDLTDVNVGLREEAARASRDVELEQFAAGLRGGPEHLDPHTQRREVEHISRLAHLTLPDELTGQMIMRPAGRDGSSLGPPPPLLLIDHPRIDDHVPR
jgi:hypothetical protein